ncbi:MAG: hypothetical protein FJ109_03475 [Deltaproteobacteria bacterium]|nr:hypothetical protein [Deltaproteobacteria bacterium]
MRQLLALLFFLLVCSSNPAAATTVRYLDLDSLVHTSALIFHGTVEEVAAKNLGSAERPRLVTDVTFTVHRVLKGANPGCEFHLRLVGGSADGHTLQIPGQPRFRKGGEVVLFLESTGVELVLNGMGQGRYRVGRDGEGRKLARRDLSGLSVVRRGRDSATIEAGALEDAVPLEDLFRRVHDLQAR